MDYPPSPFGVNIGTIYESRGKHEKHKINEEVDWVEIDVGKDAEDLDHLNVQ